MASVFLRKGSEWRLVQSLTGRRYFNAQFGKSISISDEGFMLISVPFEESPVPESHSGLAYLYEVNATALAEARTAASGPAPIFILRERWQAPRNGQVNTFWSGESAAVLGFGRAVGIQGSRGIVSSSGPMAFVFERRPSSDLPQGPTVGGQLSTTTTVTDDAFDDDLSSPPLTPDPAFQWVHEITLLAPLPLGILASADPSTVAATDAVRSFGAAVAVHGSCVAVGAPDYPTHPSHQQVRYPQTGGVFVYCENGTEAWRPVAALHSCDGSDAAGFGSALLFDEHALVVSAPSAAPGGHLPGDFQTDRPGAVYIFNVSALDAPSAFPAVSVEYAVPRGSSVQGTGPGPLFRIEHAVITARDLITRVAGPTSVHGGGVQDSTGLFGTGLAAVHLPPPSTPSTLEHVTLLAGAPEDGVLYSQGGGGGCSVQPCNAFSPDISREQGVLYVLSPTEHDFACPTPLPSPSPSNSPTPSPSSSVTALVTPSGTASASPTPTTSVSASSTPSSSATASVTPSHTAAPSSTASVSATFSSVPTPVSLGAGLQLQPASEDSSGFGTPVQSPAPTPAPALTVIMAFTGQSLSASRITREHVLRLRTALAGALSALALPPSRVIVLALQEVLPAAGAAAVRGGRALSSAQEVQVTLQADLQSDAQAIAARQRLTGSAASDLARSAAGYLASAGVQTGAVADTAVRAAPSATPSPVVPVVAAQTSDDSSLAGLSSGTVLGLSAVVALVTAGIVAVLLHWRSRRSVSSAGSAHGGTLRRFSSFSSVHSVSTAGRGARSAAQPYLSARAQGGGVHTFKPLSQLER